MARILVADDDQFTRDMVRRALATDGHEITTVEDGATALGVIEAGADFDLVITDVDMPNMSGVELAEALVARDARQRIIIMSGLADELARARSLLSPSVRMITKPVSLEKIRGESMELLG
ncbi:MAG: response regulator [Alphaproteobacteria bacterium]|nr:response regulator [Alphaproteobacteria bacterium]